MSLTISAETLPLRIDSDGVVRVGRTRVTLDTVVGAFLDGATAEEIAHRYPSVALADVYLVIAYYLRHRPEVEEYLRTRRRQSAEVQLQNEKQSDPHGIRNRLLARRPQKAS